MTDPTSAENVAAVLDQWAQRGNLKDELYALRIVCAHCGQRHHPPLSAGRRRTARRRGDATRTPSGS